MDEEGNENEWRKKYKGRALRVDKEVRKNTGQRRKISHLTPGVERSEGWRNGEKNEQCNKRRNVKENGTEG